MPDAVDAIVTSITVFILAFLGIAILGALPSVQGPLSEEATQFRVEMADMLVLMATLLGGVSLYIIAKLGSIR
jgi:hypothetical protein